jgi:hypothetical protein
VDVDRLLDGRVPHAIARYRVDPDLLPERRGKATDVDQRARRAPRKVGGAVARAGLCLRDALSPRPRDI